MSTAFDEVLKKAEIRQAEREREDERRRAERLAMKERAAQERVVRQRLEFGERFLRAVVRKVVDTKTPSSSYIRMVQQYSGSLLLQSDPLEELPRLDAATQRSILSIFSYGVKLAQEHGADIPDGFFYGQRLLAKNEETSSEDRTDNVVDLTVVAAKRKRLRSA